MIEENAGIEIKGDIEIRGRGRKDDRRERGSFSCPGRRHRPFSYSFRPVPPPNAFTENGSSRVNTRLSHDVLMFYLTTF